MPTSNNRTNNDELRVSINTALQSFELAPLREAALSLLNTLGYSSDKTIEIPDSDPQAFLELLSEHNPDIEINKEKALFEDWLQADILFQLTDEELSHETSLFKDDKVNSGLLQSYLFFAIELKQRDYARGKLTAIARQLNRVFPMPVMVFIKHRDLLSIAVINRRLNKRDAEKDVLGKVTIIRDISLANPHRGHLDILQSFALPSLLTKTAIHSFDTLHAAWEEIFNVELLNERFYKELFKWYFWALPEVSFPDDMKPAGLTKEQEADYYEKLRATGLIRLLTRLIFCWFLKEKGLIPETLFDKQALAGVLKNLDDDQPTYHQAILQNLFFATLNQRMGKDSKGEPYRKYALDEGFQKNRNTYGVDNLYRYESLFKDPDSALREFEDIPFLNGGLFDCLDRIDDNGKKIYVDGFSRNTSKRSVIPNRFFFGEGLVNLGKVTGENRRGLEWARGLVQILSSYKFTIVENTPIDQEIALDPELLGKVFENLLASYNEETKKTARKQTGSFYTPRPIVDYMVDESLKAHLATVLGREHAMAEEDARAGLDILFAYSEKQHPFEEDEVDTLIGAIDACKILDPACGSGAFPMGVLHKLVYILTKLDPDNARWKQTQLDKLDSVSMREELEHTFEANNDDYGRKLYLIENCLYGVDIQPIAIQLTKLRFFISLICDQKTNRNKAQNHGVRPLPNLETKFVAANTLIGLGEDAQMELFKSPKVVKIEEELQKVRHDYFAVQRRQQKLALQRKDKELRDELANELMQASFADQETSRKLAKWNPYDPHNAADFFEPLWMFDKTLADGFDIVIGNPPYLQVKKGIFSREQFPWSEGRDKGKQNLYKVFLEAALNFSKPAGICCLIVQSSLMADLSSARTRQMLLTQTKINQIVEFPKIAPTKAGQVFASVLQGTCICLFQNEVCPSNEFFISCNNDVTTISSLVFEPVRQDELIRFRPENFELPLFSPGEFAVYRSLFSNYVPLETLLDSIEKGDLNLGTNANSFSSNVTSVKLYRGRNIHRFSLDESVSDWGKMGYFTEKAKRNGMNVLLVCQEITGTVDPRRLIFTLIEKPGERFLFGDTVQKMILEQQSQSKVILAILNSQLMDWCFRKTSTNNHVAGYELGALPLPSSIAAEEEALLSTLVDCISVAIRFHENKASIFFEHLLDGCVYELYFREQMKRLDFSFMDDLASFFDSLNAGGMDLTNRKSVLQIYEALISTASPLYGRLVLLTNDDIDLFSLIKEAIRA